VANAFGNRLERQHVNDHGKVQIRSKQREFNVKGIVKRVNTNVDEFMADNMDIRDVDFEDVFVGYGKCFEKQWNCQFVGNDMV